MTPVEEIREAARLMRLGTPPAWQVAVANWLDGVADELDTPGIAPAGAAELGAAHDVARAYLGGAS